MKKLTAGIFATLLAVVSADSAYAAIASKGYVDEQVGTVQTAVDTVEGDVSTLKTTVASKADSSTVTALGGRVEAAEGEIDTLQTEVAGKQNVLGFTPENVSNKTTTLSGTSTDTQYPSAKAVWDTIQTETTGIASDADVTALEGRVGTLETASATHATKTELAEGLADKQDKLSQTGSASQPVYVNAEGKVTAGNTIPSVTTNIATGQTAAAQAGAVATALAAKADAADLDAYVTKTDADADYAVKALEGQVGTVSKENMGTTTATTVVGGVKEAIDAAKAADTKATGAQSAVDTVEATIGGYGDIVTHNASEFATAAQGTKADTAVQPSAISDMLTKTEAGTTYYTKTSGDTLAGRVTTAEGEIDDIQGQISNMATSETVTNLTNRVTTAEGDITALETAVNDAESGLAATNAIADSALSTAQSAQTTANAALPKTTYNTQVGTVTAGNMGTTATTVVAAIKEVAGEAAAAQNTANSANTAAGAAQEAAEEAQATANAAIPKPDGECSNPDNKCVLTFNNSAYAWEVIERGAAE